MFTIVAADPDNLENSNSFSNINGNRREAEGEVQGDQGLSKNCTSRESKVSLLSRLIRDFRNKYH